jgi:E3 ubiquitin-protein ligase HECTD1
MMYWVFRSIVWLQGQRDVTLERQRGPGLSPRRDDPHEYRVGRLKHERVKVPREGDLLSWAMQVMQLHASRKSILEVSNPSHYIFLFVNIHFVSPSLLC